MQSIRFTEGFAAPELKQGDPKRIGVQTDVYGIGALLYWLIFDRCPDARDGDWQAEYDYSGIRLQETGWRDRMYALFTDFFHHTLASFEQDRWQDMSRVLEALDEMKQYADPEADYVCSVPLSRQDCFAGRQKELEFLAQYYGKSQNAFLILDGMGGIGKSALIRQFLSLHKSEYDAVIWLDYRGNMTDHLISDREVRISTVTRMEQETRTEYYHRKMRKLREIAGKQRIFAVVDNFFFQEGEDLSDFLEIPWQGVLITRETGPFAQMQSLHLGPVEKPEQRKLFEGYLGRRVSEKEAGMVSEIMQMILGHTLTAQLLAKVVASGELSLNQAADFVRHHRLDGLKPEMYQIRDRRIYQGRISRLLMALLQMEKIGPDRQSVMKTLGAFDLPGIRKKDWFLLAGKTSQQRLHELLKRGWILENGDRIFMHPVIRDLVKTWEWESQMRQAEENMMRRFVPLIRQTYQAYQHLSGQNRENMEEYRFLAGEMLSWYPFEDSTKHCLQYQMITILPQSEEDEILLRSAELLRRGKDLKSSKKAGLHYQIAYIYDQREDAQAALREVKKASRFVRFASDDMEKAKHRFWLAMEYEQTGAYDKAIRLLRAAEKSARNLAEKTGSIRIWEEYARYLTRDAHWQMEHESEEAMNLKDISGRLRMAERICRKVQTDDIDLLFACLSNRSLCGCYRKEPEKKILKNMERGVAVIRKMSGSDYFYIENIVLYQCQIYHELHRMQEAEEVIREGIHLCERHADAMPYVRKRLDLMLTLAWLCCEQKNFLQERECLNQITAVLRERPDLNPGQKFLRDYRAAIFWQKKQGCISKSKNQNRRVKVSSKKMKYQQRKRNLQ